MLSVKEGNIDGVETAMVLMLARARLDQFS
jgi:hypothetical protein